MIEFKSTENGVAIVVTLILPPGEGIHEIINGHNEALNTKIKNIRTKNIVKDFPEITCVDGGKTDDGKEYVRATFMPRDIAVESSAQLLGMVDKCVADTKRVYEAIYNEVQEFLESLKTEDKTESDDVTNQAIETAKFESLGEFLREIFKDVTGMEKGDKITLTIELA